jgi:hypothetical protein
MRKLLFLVTILPLYSLAQNFEFGLNAGCNFHFLPEKNIYTSQDKAKIGYAAAFKADLVLPHSQIGVGVDVVNFIQYNYLIPGYTIRQDDHIANPLISPNAFYNRTWRNIINGYLYTGFSGGLVIAKIGVNTWEYNNGQYANPTGYSTTYNSAFGFSFGLQGGAVLKINEQFAVNLEIALKYVNYNYSAPGPQLQDPYFYRLFYIPITVGFRYLD